MDLGFLRHVMDCARNGWINTKQEVIEFFHRYEKEDNVKLDYNVVWEEAFVSSNQWPLIYGSWCPLIYCAKIEEGRKIIWPALVELGANPLIEYPQRHSPLAKVLFDGNITIEMITSVVDVNRKKPFHISSSSSWNVISACDIYLSWNECGEEKSVAHLVNDILHMALLANVLERDQLITLSTRMIPEVSRVIRMYITWLPDIYDTLEDNEKNTILVLMLLQRTEDNLLYILPRELMYEIFNYL